MRDSPDGAIPEEEQTVGWKAVPGVTMLSAETWKRKRKQAEQKKKIKKKKKTKRQQAGGNRERKRIVNTKWHDNYTKETANVEGKGRKAYMPTKEGRMDLYSVKKLKGKHEEVTKRKKGPWDRVKRSPSRSRKRETAS